MQSHPPCWLVTLLRKFTTLKINNFGRRKLQSMRSTVVEMLQNSATQLEKIQNILSEFIEAHPAEDIDGVDCPPQTRPRQSREPRRRTKIDLRLKVSTPPVSFEPAALKDAPPPRRKYDSTLF